MTLIQEILRLAQDDNVFARGGKNVNLVDKKFVEPKNKMEPTNVNILSCC